MTTPRNLRLHLEGYSGCPHCGSVRVTYQPIQEDATNGDLTIDGNCRECGKRWKDRYRIVETIQVADTEAAHAN